MERPPRIQDVSLAGNHGKAVLCSKLIGTGAFSEKYVTPITITMAYGYATAMFYFFA
jgi:hypothetical protein